MSDFNPQLQAQLLNLKLNDLRAEAQEWRQAHLGAKPRGWSALLPLVRFQRPKNAEEAEADVATPAQA